MSPGSKILGVALAALIDVSGTGLLHAQDVVPMSPMVVTATRAPVPVGESAAAVRVLDRDKLDTAPALAPDDILRGVAGFGLFRRAGSLTANPTTHGVSLRGLGANGASRSLVLLDGMPLNDPFGGWVAWGKVPAVTLDRVEIVSGGGSVAWGAGVLGGVAQFFSAKPEPGRGAARLVAGTDGLFAAEATHAAAAGTGVVRFEARTLDYDGSIPVAPEQRGAVDRSAGQQHRLAALTWRTPLGQSSELTITARRYDEDRTNGTAGTDNRTREHALSLRLEGRSAARGSWHTSAFLQSQEFAARFTAVDTARAIETPASEQFAVPATAGGISAGWVQDHAHGRWQVGADWRFVRGETREDFLFTAGRFTRRRHAGGDQGVGGVFARAETSWPAGWRASAALRLDHARRANGHRREGDRITGVATRTEEFPGRSTMRLHPEVGVVWQVTENLRWRALARTAFRPPTLNELHRPFRVGSVVTEPNDALRDERLTAWEVGAEWRATEAWMLSATWFDNRLRDAVANVTVGRGPGVVPGFGFLPEGGVARRRLNLDELRSRGVEARMEFFLGENWSAAVEAQWVDAAVQRADVAPALTGKRPAQTPGHVLVAELRGKTGPWAGTLRVRRSAAQFEDDENTLRLATATTVEAVVRFELAHGWELSLVGENLFDAVVENSRTSASLVTRAAPRSIWTALGRKW